MTAAEAADAADFGTASARKTGRDPRWPYVPVLTGPGAGAGRSGERQILGVAYATRGEAIAAAELHILALRADLRRKLEQPNYRALRRQYGVTA